MRRPTRQWFRGEQGFSVMELLVALIVLQGLFLLVFAAYSSGVVVLANTSRDWQSQEGARSTLQVLSRNLRQAVLVETADANQVGFYADLNNDGIEEAIVYRLDPASGTIERGVSSTDGDADGRADAMPATFEAFLPSVTNAVGTFLTYYDANGNDLSVGGPGWPAQVRAIGLDVQVDISTTDRQPPGRYQTIVHLRNIALRSN